MFGVAPKRSGLCFVEPSRVCLVCAVCCVLHVSRALLCALLCCAQCNTVELYLPLCYWTSTYLAQNNHHSMITIIIIVKRDQLGPSPLSPLSPLSPHANLDSPSNNRQPPKGFCFSHELALGAKLLSRLGSILCLQSNQIRSI